MSTETTITTTATISHMLATHAPILSAARRRWLGGSAPFASIAVALVGAGVSFTTDERMTAHNIITDMRIDIPNVNAIRPDLSDERFPTCSVCGTEDVEDAGDHADSFGHWPKR